MTFVKADVDPIPAEDVHVPLLAGLLLNEVRLTFAAEDWGGLRQSHFRLLGTIPRGGLNVTELAARLGMTKQACGEFVTFLAGTGHLTTASDPADRRARLVSRTPLGDRTVAAVNARIRRIERSWARQVGPERYAEFRAVLTELATRAAP